MTNKKLANLPRFNDVENNSLQAWNRCVITFNICKDLGQEYGKKYVEEFNAKEKLNMMAMFSSVKTEGYEATRAQVMKSSEEVIH